jgi:5'-3' exoribonuclease 1
MHLSSQILTGILLINVFGCNSFVQKTSFLSTKLLNKQGNKFVTTTTPFQISNPHEKSHETRSELNVHHGIPKLFRWLVDLYPIVLESVGEGLSGSNAMAVDNFYLDMNGIIHTCTHSNNDKLVLLNEREMFQRIFSYTDRLYKLVKPSKLMYLAVDGVAPRAKMNQQRSRRFRSSKEREALLADYVAKEGKLPDEESFDSNCITPGTEFMFRLGIAFRRWIAYKMETDPFWQTGAEVVFSGPDVPGEGEHKVQDMIRSFTEKDPNYERGSLRHCMYGLDADLIMLSLVTHEPFFVLLREKISKRKQNKDAMSYSPEDFELLEISLLRKMLKQHFRRLEIEMDEAHARAASYVGMNKFKDIYINMYMCIYIYIYTLIYILMYIYI